MDGVTTPLFSAQSFMPFSRWERGPLGGRLAPKVMKADPAIHSRHYFISFKHYVMCNYIPSFSILTIYYVPTISCLNKIGSCLQRRDRQKCCVKEKGEI